MATLNAADLAQACLTTLRNLGVDATWSAGVVGADDGIDGRLMLDVDGRHHVFDVQLKRHFRPSLTPLVHNRLPNGGVLFTDRLTPGAAAALREVGLNAVDGQGNASLRAPGLRIEVSGQQRAKTSSTGRSELNRAGIPVLFAFLVQPDLVDSTVREIEPWVPVSVGTIQSVRQWLRDRGDWRPGRGLHSSRPELERLWIEAYLNSYRPRMPVLKYTSGRGPVRDWIEEAVGETALVAGEAARYLSGASIRPAGASIFTIGSAHTFIKAGRLKADDDGEIEVRSAFFSSRLSSPAPGLAPELLTRAELYATRDPRVIALASEPT